MTTTDTSTDAKSPDEVPEPSAEAERTDAIDWDNARDLFEEHGLSMREISRRVGCSPTTVSEHARKGQWARNSEAVAKLDHERRARAQAAVEANREAWAQRRLAEADDAAATAKLARLTLVDSMGDRDWHMVRATSIAYGILIDKAQLLSGEATSRDVVVTDDHLLASRARRDELKERRERFAAVS